jgi:hypothetical protein
MDAIFAYGRIPFHIQEIISTIAQIRSGTLSIPSLDDFRERVVSQMTQRRRSRHAPISFFRIRSPMILRDIVTLAYQVAYLTQACHEHFLEQLRTIQPQHPIDQQFRYHHEYGPNDAYVPAWERRPEGQEYPKRDVGPPSWVEEQRVAGAFWRIQLLYDLKIAAMQLPSSLGWPSEDLDRLQRMDPVDLYRHPHYQCLEEIVTVVEYIRSVQAEGDHPNRTTLPSIDGYVGRASMSYYQRDDHDERQTRGNLPHLPDVDYRQQRLRLPAPACSFFRSLTHSDFSPLRTVQFESFRRFGFAFWDQERMAALGLMDPVNPTAFVPEDFYYFAWRSILPPDEVARLEKRLREERQEQEQRLWRSD